MPVKTSLKSRILDKKDRQILTILQDNGRESLTKIAKKVGLSIDSVNNRLKAMSNKGIFEPGIFINPEKIGFPLIVDVYIKLKSMSLEEKNQFIALPGAEDKEIKMAEYVFQLRIDGKVIGIDSPILTEGEGKENDLKKNKEQEKIRKKLSLELTKNFIREIGSFNRENMTIEEQIESIQQDRIDILEELD